MYSMYMALHPCNDTNLICSLFGLPFLCSQAAAIGLKNCGTQGTRIKVAHVYSEPWLPAVHAPLHVSHLRLSTPGLIIGWTDLRRQRKSPRITCWLWLSQSTSPAVRVCIVYMALELHNTKLVFVSNVSLRSQPR
jgi:hypothetical protein